MKLKQNSTSHHAADVTVGSLQYPFRKKEEKEEEEKEKNNNS